MPRISIPIPSMPPLLTDVSQPTVTPQGTGGSTTWGYEIVAIDANGKKTATSTEGTSAAGNATLDDTNFNRVTWTDITGGVTYEIWRESAGGTPSTTGLIGTVGSGVQQFDDTGLTATAGTPNATNTTGDGEELALISYAGNFALWVSGIGTGTYQTQLSAGDDVWVNEGAAFTADGVLAVSAQGMYVRLKCTAFTSGTPICKVVGWT